MEFIVAKTVNQAKDAADLIEVDYEMLLAAIEAEAALAPGAPAVWPANSDNEAFHATAGNKAAVDAAFARTAHVVKHRTVSHRITTNSMEPRACVAEYDPDHDKYTIRCTVQSVHVRSRRSKATRASRDDSLFGGYKILRGIIFVVHQQRPHKLCQIVTSVK